MKDDFLNSYEDVNVDYQNELAVRYLPAVKAMSYRLKERLPSSVDVLDLISIGTEELIKLTRRYNEELNDSFWGYAKKRVYGAMLDFLRSLDTISRNDRRLIKDVEKAIIFYYDKNSEEPTSEWLANHLNEDLNKVERARFAGDTHLLMPITEQVQIYADIDTPSAVEHDELIRTVKKILIKMSSREQLIIQLYFFEELNLKEISDILKITESRISQIIKSVTRKIRQELL